MTENAPLSSKARLFLADAGPCLVYLIGFAIGLGLALELLPLEFLFPRVPAASALSGDAAQHAIAQRYFIRDDWHWPPLDIRNVGAPERLNIALIDGIPAFSLVLKLLRHHLADGFYSEGLWYGVAFIAQPVAAIWCLRGTGSFRPLPEIVASVLAVSMPCFLNRFGHASLFGQFVLFLSLGFYFRLVSNSGSWRWTAACASACLALLVHPYLGAMSLSLLAAVPLTLLLRGEPDWRRAALGLAATFGAVSCVLWLGGYFGAKGDGGYGNYSLNLLSPFWPYGSALFGTGIDSEIAVPGGDGWEGYNWLGAGVGIGLVACLVAARGTMLAAVYRHSGLAIVLAGLVLFAISPRVSFGDRLLLDLPAPSVLGQFRSSGRFFWPVACVLLIGCVHVLSTVSPRRKAILVLVAVGAIQYFDASPLRSRLSHWASSPDPWLVDAGGLRDLLGKANRVVLLPSWGCSRLEPWNSERALQRQVELLVSEFLLKTNSISLARWYVEPPCRDDIEGAAPLQEGDLRLTLPSANGRIAKPSGVACRMVGQIEACTAPVGP